MFDIATELCPIMWRFYFVVIVGLTLFGAYWGFSESFYETYNNTICKFIAITCETILYASLGFMAGVTFIVWGCFLGLMIVLVVIGRPK